MADYLSLPIKTERLTLRAFRPEDGDDLYEYLSDPDTVWFEPYKPFNVEAARAEAVRRAGDESFIAVELGGKMIGNIYFAPEGEPGTMEIGYVFNKDYGHRGYATEAARAVMDAAFSRGLKLILAGCAKENAPSWRLLERLDMTRVLEKPHGVTFKKDKQGNDIWWTTLRYEKKA